MTKSPTCSTPLRPLSPAVRKHMSVIGKLGGAAGKGKPNRIELCRLNTIRSWTPEARAKRLSTLSAKRLKIVHNGENKS